MEYESVVRCPKCGFRKSERMPSDCCLIRYNCTSCGFVLVPKKGDDCVFCSYGSVPCPSVQQAKGLSGEGI